jgi:hypothetical protein
MPSCPVEKIFSVGGDVATANSEKIAGITVEIFLKNDTDFSNPIK